MIETVEALGMAGEIAALEGIDYMSFGLMDLAQSLGHQANLMLNRSGRRWPTPPPVSTRRASWCGKISSP